MFRPERWGMLGYGDLQIPLPAASREGWPCFMASGWVNDLTLLFPFFNYRREINFMRRRPGNKNYTINTGWKDERSTYL
jgi:hypothetical protein